MLFQLFVLGILAAFAKADLMLTDCAPNTPHAPPMNMLQITKLKIEGCTAEPCTFIKGTKFKTEIVAKLNYTATSILFSGIAIINGISVELMNGNWCDKVTIGSCKDMKPGAEIGGESTVLVLPASPAYAGPMRLIVKDDKKLPQYCGELKIKVLNDPKLRLKFEGG